MKPVIAEVHPPGDGIWRVGHAPNPLIVGKPLTPDELNDARTGNRFDSPTGQYGVLYCASDLECCFAETLGRFRPDPRILPVIHGDWERHGYMEPGDVSRDWRQRRMAVRVSVDPGLPFLDIESAGTRAFLEPRLAPFLAAYGYGELDIPTVMTSDRRVTRLISQWAWAMVDEQSNPGFAGIRYLSRLGTEWECWAVFDRTPIAELELLPITLEMESLQSIRELYGLRIF
jgi:RES domain